MTKIFGPTLSLMYKAGPNVMSHLPPIPSITQDNPTIPASMDSSRTSPRRVKSAVKRRDLHVHMPLHEEVLNTGGGHELAIWATADHT